MPRFCNGRRKTRKVGGRNGTVAESDGPKLRQAEFNAKRRGALPACCCRHVAAIIAAMRPSAEQVRERLKAGRRASEECSSAQA